MCAAAAGPFYSIRITNIFSTVFLGKLSVMSSFHSFIFSKIKLNHELRGKINL